jgi:predicted phage terminase large subunit-like protein
MRLRIIKRLPMRIKFAFDLTPAQREFQESADDYTIFLSGRGGGKTLSSVLRLVSLPAGSRAVYLGPTHTFFQDVTMPEIERLDRELYKKAGIKLISKKSMIFRELTFINGTTVAFRSTKNFEERRGMNAKYLFMDEAARIPNEAYDVIAAILRVPGCRMYVTTTPRGKRSWLYNLCKNPKRPTKIIRASTRDNKHIDPSYYDTLKSIYSNKFAAQELEAEFVDDASAIDPDWVLRYDSIPQDDKIVCTVLTLDPAPSLDEEADYSAFCVMSRTESGNYYVQHLSHDHYTINQIIAKLLDLYMVYKPDRCIIEAISFMQYVVQEARRAGVPATGVVPKGDKIARSIPLSGLMERKILHLHNSVDERIIEEILDFPEGSHDDTVDALSYAANSLVSLKNFSFEDFITNQ